jgi:cellulose synthase/poly-beta-1,6-N-acetylglucosamine synthase-like glycosyltransferase
VTALVFWTCAGLAGLTYVGYPVLVALRATLVPRPHRAAEFTPTLSIVVAAHDEADVIAARIENLLVCDYPAERREIIVASDGSQDATVAVAARYADQGVRVLDLERAGKTATLNVACAAAQGDLLVFTDANTVFDLAALRALARPFSDPAVGGVAGDQRYLVDHADRGAGAGERRYWDLDRQLKLRQSRAGSVISATGAIYAIRRELFEPIPAGVTDDFYVSTAPIAHGRRLVFEPDAVAYEPAAPSAGLEFGRKVRVVTQGLRAIHARRALLAPTRTGFYAIQLWLHKVLRRLMFLPLAGLLVTALLAWPQGGVYRVAAVGQLGLYGAGLGGLAWTTTGWRLPRALALPAFFVLANAACVVAVVNVARGRRIDRWQPKRGLASDGPPIVSSGGREPTGGPDG